PVRTLELSGFAPVRTSESALLVPEELGLEQTLRDRGAVDLDERTATARRGGMDGSGHQVFADAAFTPDQDRRIRIGDTLDDGPDGAHLGASVEERMGARGLHDRSGEGQRRSGSSRVSRTKGPDPRTVPRRLHHPRTSACCYTADGHH